MLIVTPSVGFCNCSIFCFALYVHSSFAKISMRKRDFAVDALFVVVVGPILVGVAVLSLC